MKRSEVMNRVACEVNMGLHYLLALDSQDFIMEDTISETYTCVHTHI